MLAEERSVVSGCHWLCVDLDDAADSLDNNWSWTQGRIGLPNTVIVGLSQHSSDDPILTNSPLLPWVDLIVTRDLPQDMVTKAAANLRQKPQASTGLIQLLRQGSAISVHQGLLMESLMYSTLQHGAEFESWLNRRDSSAAAVDAGPSTRIQRENDCLTITLNRPDKHNAFSATMRDELCQALYLAQTDSSIGQIVLKGQGPSFCAGGDLEEFGSARDASLAHLSRTTRSPASLMAALAARTTAQLHGACIGAGIELTAFAGRVVAREDTTFALPEVSFGLVPGAGGTVSIPRRIGRHRAGLLALSGHPIDAALALEWGLIDRLAG